MAASCEVKESKGSLCSAGGYRVCSLERKPASPVLLPTGPGGPAEEATPELTTEYQAGLVLAEGTRLSLHTSFSWPWGLLTAHRSYGLRVAMGYIHSPSESQLEVLKSHTAPPQFYLLLCFSLIYKNQSHLYFLLLRLQANFRRQELNLPAPASISLLASLWAPSAGHVHFCQRRSSSQGSPGRPPPPRVSPRLFPPQPRAAFIVCLP